MNKSERKSLKTGSTGERVMYVKVGEYYKQYLKVRYGEPVRFHPSSPLALCVETGIVDNPLMKNLTLFSYSDVAYHYEEERSLFSLQDVASPSPEDKPMFIAVVIPDSVNSRLGPVRTSSYWQFCKAGAIEFRKLVKREFWIEAMRFIDDCFYRARQDNDTTTIEKAMSDFMIAYKIPFYEFENLLRYERRVRKEMEADIEKRRDALEARCGQSFLYT